MDIETENVINLIFPDGIQESWKENPEFYQYLSKLGGYDVDQLCKEPDHLDDEKTSVLQTTQELVFGNYKTFVQTAESSREIFKQFNQTESRLNGLVQKIPKFVEKCQSFCDVSKDINAHRRVNSLTLTRNAELLEVLEMPQLMESCLRSNQYNEALELSQYARQLGVKHGDIPIISSIVAEIESSWSGMVGQVVGSLRGDLPLPRCLQLVGLLRSMDAFTEPELRIKFLQARDSWLQSLLNTIPKDDANLHITKTIELSRIHLFNIITQYRAMFNDDELIMPGRDPTVNECAIFHHWLEEKISQFLTTLEQDLPGVTSIDSILGQCTYFGLSFGRVGVDFTGRLSDIFVHVIGDKFESSVRKTTKKFEKDMESFTLINKMQRANTKVNVTIKSENPPEQLVEFYPLAEYCNGLISTFNEIRLCPPVALSIFCTNTLQESLYLVAKAILIFYKQEQQAFAAAERENMLKFTECLSEQLIPYVQYCIHVIFPPCQIAIHLGISENLLQTEGITYLNRDSILEPLAPLLPVPKNGKDTVTSSLSTSNVQSILQKASNETSSASENTGLDITPVQLERMRVSESQKSVEQAVISDDKQEKNTVTTKDVKVTINSSTDDVNQNR
ncbi:PREDICTED: conserved oligomeric Golgi complex subunit 8 [Dufourea novaeangliae]|uniref:Conserved oligomeric Golgi complex subunit 8 n=1 Tax=Dufourea novaeangliae TaxID=178035 RepID=A0A154P8Y3_DUFNO|nr:PREDICTED: conserved oligomeric Golgi complex subunit 8 [Dufourea novaeangliae]KZC07678.1 Conserved oligomeric Golgi complex subunit 8 [Dufourea novaeangliae]